MPRNLHLGGFLIPSQVVHSHGAWRHPASDTAFTTPEYYHRIGRILERGKFDFVFFADLLGVPERYGASIGESLRRGTQASAVLDPSIVAASLGAVTSKLGVIITKSTTYFHPYEVARIFSTLDHVTRGRVGWNIVTSLSQAEARNFGHAEHLDHASRYRRADEFLDAASGLWAGWEPDALVLDKDTGVFADPSRIRHLDFAGEFFSTRGPLNLPHSPQGRPVLVQAGSSATGRDFAARWGEAVFALDATAEGRRAIYADIKSRAADHGRDPDQVLIFPAFMPFVGETESIAREKQAFHNELADPTSGIVTLSNALDHDFSRYDPDGPLENVQNPATKGYFDMIRGLAERNDLTLRDVGRGMAQGMLLPQVVGTAKQVADQIEESFLGREGDGFMISPAQLPGTFNDFVDSVVPELQRRGLFRTDYAGSTLREHLGLSPAVRSRADCLDRAAPVAG